MKLKYRVSLLLLLCTLGAAPFRVAAQELSEPPILDVEVNPSAVHLAWGRPTDVLVVVRNPSEERVRDVRLSWIGGATVNVSADPTDPQTLPPYGARTWLLEIDRQGETPPLDTLFIRVDYAVGNPSEGVTGVVVEALPIESAEIAPVEDVATVEIQTAIETVMERQVGLVNLVVTNLTASPIEIAEILTRSPDFVSIRVPDLQGGLVVPPGEGVTLPAEVRAPGAIRPGKHMLLFEVVLEWLEAGRTRRGSVVKAHTFEAAVVGESPILTVLGVPSLLVLPGFLMVTIWRFLWRRAWPKQECGFAADSPEFWVAAISLSIPAAALYPLLTGRDYLAEYGLVDIWSIWFGSIVSVFAVYGMTFVIAISAEQVRKRIRRRRLPQRADDPLTVLRKLSRQGMGFYVPTVALTQEGRSHAVHLLQPWDEDLASIWVGPRMCVEWLTPARELQARVEACLDHGEDADELADLLGVGLDREVLTLRWDRVAGQEGPFEAQMEALGRPSGDLRRILYQD